MSDKPTIFIGSSVEGLPVAYAIQSELQPHDAHCTIWNQGTFKLSSGTLDSLIKASKIADYAIFVFTPDDIAIMRREEQSVVRDNVIFECGLFMGALGKENVFFVKPVSTNMHIPTDLVGTTPGEYDSSATKSHLQSALGHFCSQVRDAITDFDIISLEREISNIDELFPGEWKNEWVESDGSKMQETFQIINNQFVIRGEHQFDIKNIRINERKGYIKLTRIGVNSQKGRILSVTIMPLHGNTRKGSKMIVNN